MIETVSGIVLIGVVAYLLIGTVLGVFAWRRLRGEIEMTALQVVAYSSLAWPLAVREKFRG